MSLWVQIWLNKVDDQYATAQTIITPVVLQDQRFKTFEIAEAVNMSKERVLYNLEAEAVCKVDASTAGHSNIEADANFPENVWGIIKRKTRRLYGNSTLQ